MAWPIAVFGLPMPAENEKHRTPNRVVPESRTQKFIYSRFVEAGYFFLTFNDYRPFQKIRILEHELDRLVFARRLLLHVHLAVKRRARAEKRFDGIVADQFAQLVLGEGRLAVFSFFKVYFLRLQETSCFTAGGSRGFVNKLDFIGHVSSRRKPFKVQGFKVKAGFGNP